MDSLFGAKKVNAQKLTGESEREVGRGIFSGEQTETGEEQPVGEQIAAGDAALRQEAENLANKPEEAEKVINPILGRTAVEAAWWQKQEQKAIESTQAVKEIVATENGYSEDERELGANLVGAESQLEVKERTQEDAENLAMETGQGWQHNLLTKNQERLTTEAVHQIDHVIKKESYRPAQLVAWKSRWTKEMLATYGRKLGERN